MIDDLENQLRNLRPAPPSTSLKTRVRAQLEAETPGLAIPHISVRRLIPVAACALVLVVAGVALSRRPVAADPTICSYGQVPAQVSTSVYYQDAEPPLQITRTSSQAYVAWHDTKAGQEIITTFPYEQIVISPVSIQ